jgi:tetratricopeptide (TPR) repeat protein
MKKSLLLLLFTCASLLLHAQKVFDFTPTCEQAYKEIVALKIKSGQQLVAAARRENPNNLIPEMLESYIDFFVLFFTEDPAEFKLRKSNFGKHLDAIDDGPESSPFYLYCKGVVHLHKALSGVKFGERFNAALDFRKAFIEIKDNRSDFPQFTPNEMIFGPLQVAVGSIPQGYKWVSNLLGMKGSVTGGMKNERGFIFGKDNYSRLFSAEATFYYCYMMFYIENKQEEAVNFINTSKLDLVNNHLLAYMAVNLNVNSKHPNVAESIINNRNKSADYLSTHVWEFEMSYAKLYHLELAEAARGFDHFTKTFKGNFYLKDALQKLSWCYYLQGNMAAAEATRKLILSRGNTETDADKKALKDAKTGVFPNPVLLKARLLNDGGYHKEAYAVLEGKKSTDFPDPVQQLEFIYRVARIYDDLGYDDKAIPAYENVIRQGIERKEYFAARAALQIGYVLEKQGKKAQAIAYYQKCLDMDDHEYKDSIDQRAKSGIARCKGE